MKTLRFYAAAIAAFAFLSISNIQAQPQHKNGGWQDRVLSEKIAFFTAELNLSPEEAQVFWPVYNKIAAEKKELNKAVRTSYKALLEALNSDTVTDKEIDKLLDDYLAAKQANKEAGKDDVKEYRKVLSSKKVAKLYVAEEKFRRNQIHKMKPGPRK
jgi:hypothetical protein